MFQYKHCAYNTATGEFLCSSTPNGLKRFVREFQRRRRIVGREFVGKSEWRFCHNHGKKWFEAGLV